LGTRDEKQLLTIESQNAQVDVEGATINLDRG
jgi:hypothetical protein